MSDLLNLGAAGLRSYQSALQIVGDNITNANTPGYSRRVARLSEAQPAGLGDPLQAGTASGGGVRTTGILRAYDQFKTNDARTASGDYTRLAVRQRWLTDLQTGLGTGSGSVADGLTRFFNAAQDVAADPTASAARQAFVDSAGAVAQRFRTASASITAVRSGIRDEIGADVVQLNQLTQALAGLNDKLRRVPADSTEGAALRDQRDSLLGQIGDLTRISVEEASDGRVDVRMGEINGPLLVSQKGDVKLVGFKTVGGATQLTVDPFGGDIAASAGSGALAGLLDAESRARDAGAQLDTLASNFVADVNAQHRLGKDLSGTAGGDLFAAVSLAATGSPTNAGTASVAASVTGALSPQGYSLWYDGATAAWTLSRADGSGAVTGTGTLDLDGVHLTLGGSPHDGDHFTIGAASGAATMAVALTDPATVAASTGGDSGDNSNIAALIDLRLSSRGAYEDRYDKQVSSVASALADTKSLATATKSLRDSSVLARDNGSGVNLDDEAADLLRYQQAYQACSKIISIAQTLFDTLMGIK